MREQLMAIFLFKFGTTINIIKLTKVDFKMFSSYDKRF